jgi:hypothetical protein
MADETKIIHFNNGSATQWDNQARPLDVGEPGYNSTTGELKVGDGASSFAALKAFLTSDNALAQLSAIIGAANGIAPLDAGAKIPGSNIPFAALAEILAAEPPDDKPVSAAQFAARGAYFVGEIYPLLVPRPGFMLANGQTLENVDVAYPALLAWLLDDGQYGGAGMNVSLADWNAEWNDDAGKWRGQQGACGKYSLDLAAKTIKMPDWRGLVAEYAGYDGGAAGGTHGDMIRNIIGSFATRASLILGTTGAMYYSMGTVENQGTNVTPAISSVVVNLDPSRVVPVGNATKPRAVMVHPCAYVGGGQ